jgi:hypothetical protein
MIRSLLLAALFLSASGPAMAQNAYDLFVPNDAYDLAPGETSYAGTFQYTRDYCVAYIKGVSELVKFENTTRSTDERDLRDASRDSGNESLSILYDNLSHTQTLLLEMRVIKYAKGHNFTATFPGDANLQPVHARQPSVPAWLDRNLSLDLKALARRSGARGNPGGFFASASPAASQVRFAGSNQRLTH